MSWNGAFMEEKDQLEDLLLKLACPCRILAQATDCKCNENDCSSVHDTPDILKKISMLPSFILTISPQEMCLHWHSVVRHQIAELWKIQACPCLRKWHIPPWEYYETLKLSFYFKNLVLCVAKVICWFDDTFLLLFLFNFLNLCLFSST